MAILHVDDDRSVRDAVQRALTVFGFAVVSVDGVRAAELALAERGDITGALLDAGLGDGTGIDIYDWIAIHRPDLTRRIAFVTGSSSTALFVLLAAIGCPILRKPCEVADLTRLAAEWEALAVTTALQASKPG